VKLPRALDVLAIGNINADISFFVEKAPAEDSEVIASDYEVFSGGSAANFAVGVSRLGLKAGIIACVGGDDLGRRAVTELDKEGVATDLVKIESAEKTGVVCVIVEGGGGRRMVAYRGANSLLAAAAAEGLRKAETKFIQLCNVKKDVLKEALRLKGSATVSFDPGGASGELLPDDLWGVDILMVNELECAAITGKRWDLGADAISRVVGKVVVKRGARGSLLIEGGKKYWQEAYDAKVIDTTGAGDAFDAGFVSALVKGFSPSVCMKWGAAAAALKIQRRGARVALPTEVELTSFLYK